MRIAVFDCPLGIAGDMTIGALLDAGMPFTKLREELGRLPLSGYRLKSQEVRCGAFRARKFSVNLNPSHHRRHTSLREIEKQINVSRISKAAKQTAIKIFRCLGRAEARVHGIGLQKVHFHEVGAIDSIVDIVGTAVCFQHLKIQRAYVRRIFVGRGLQSGSHGKMPVPVPGAYELLKGFSLSQSDHDQEMVTPTGAAVLAALCSKAQRIPKMKLMSVGYGAGDRIFSGSRGLLRVSLGDV